MVSINPHQTPAALLREGARKFQAGQVRDAIDCYCKALSSWPDNADAHLLLGLAYRAEGNLNKAVAELMRASQLNPDSFETFLNLGLSLHDLGQPDASIAALERSVELEKGFPDAHYNLGRVLHSAGRYSEAVPCFREVIRLKPEFAEAHAALGGCLGAMHQFDQAEAACRQAIKLKPSGVSAYTNLASVLEKANRTDDVKSVLTCGLGIAPNELLLNLVAARIDRRQGNYQDAIDRLSRFTDSDAGEIKTAQIHNELGQVHNAAEHYDQAFYHFSECNRRKEQVWDMKGMGRGAYLHEIEVIGNLFENGSVRHWPSVPPVDNKVSPVFLIGFPRSGTTLLDQILDSHPQIQTLEERHAVSSVEHAIASLPMGYPNALIDPDVGEVEMLRSVYFGKVDEYLERNPEQLLVDKFPLNIAKAGLIWRIFPQAKFLVTIRHPCDVCLSGFMQDFSLNPAMSFFFTLEDAAKLYHAVMGNWLKFVQYLPLNHHLVRYEDLVTDFDTTVRKVLEFLDVDWDDAVLEFDTHARQRSAIRTPSYLQVTQPIYRKAIYRWKHYASYFESAVPILDTYIQHWGYTDI